MQILQIFLGGILLLNLGCSQKYISHENYLITIKTNRLKYSDIGIISRSENGVKVEIFSVGNQILELELDSFVSVNGETPIPYSIFNSKFLSKKYPEQIIKNIFSGKEIFGGKNRQNIYDGFQQKIENINYRVTKKEIRFKDKNILIKIKNLK
ncbi:hypothetical protein ThvES_00003420 [Thiovulum sp. ES]|nr:hypothetical protein ThvES_00003420 [Thiovulum sp. ES]